MKHTNRRFNKLINVYMRRLRKWNAYFTPARKETPAELRLWHALGRARIAADTLDKKYQ